MPVTPEQFKDAFSRHPAGVALVMWHHGQQINGLTLSSVASTSAEPPMFVFSVASYSRRLASLRAAPRISVSLLASDQVEAARRFARPEVGRPSTTDEIEMSAEGLPILSGSRAWIAARVVSELVVGSSVLLVAKIDVLRVGREAPPLLYHGRRYGTLTEFEPG